jgi:hypothetical protein
LNDLFPANDVGGMVDDKQYKRGEEVSIDFITEQLEKKLGIGEFTNE